MAPSMQAKKRNLAVCRAGAVLALLSFLAGCKDVNRYAAPPPRKVIVAQPVAERITRYLETTGSMAAYNSVDLVARVEGFLQEQGYTDGQLVTKGTVLFTVEPPPYEAKLQQAQAAEQGAQARLKNAETELQRQAALVTQDFTSRAKYDDALTQRETDKADVLQAQANTELAAINYSYTRVVAPFAGIVTAHLKSVGEVVGGTQPTKLAAIVQIEPIYANFNVSETDVQRIRADLAKRGLTVADLGKVPVEVGLQTETGYPHAGTLDYYSPQVDAATGTLPTRGVFANKDHVLLPGNFVRVRVPVQRDVDALLVPDVALGSDQAGQYVLVVDAGNVVHQRHVTPGELVDRMRVIDAGLKPDDRVVVAGVQAAIPGDKVDPQVQTAEAATPARTN